MKSSRTSLDFPIPGTPTIVTSCGADSSRTRTSVSLRSAISRSRPTIGTAVETASVRTVACASRACQTGIGSAFPLASTGGRLADEDPVHRRGGLETRCRVDDVAGGHSFSCFGMGVEIDQRFAGVHGEAHLDRAVLARPVADRQRRSHRPFRIVLVRNRRAEQRHHRVADELLHRPAEALEL